MPDRIFIQKEDTKKKRYLVILSFVGALFALFLIAVQIKMTFTKGAFAQVEQSFNCGYDQIQAGLDYAQSVPVDLQDPSDVIESMSQEFSNAIADNQKKQEALDLIANEMINEIDASSQ